MNKKEEKWETDDEEAFVNSLDSREKVEGYLAGAELRRDWGMLDKTRIMEAARKALQSMKSEKVFFMEGIAL